MSLTQFFCFILFIGTLRPGLRGKTLLCIVSFSPLPIPSAHPSPHPYHGSLNWIDRIWENPDPYTTVGGDVDVLPGSWNGPRKRHDAAEVAVEKQDQEHLGKSARNGARPSTVGKHWETFEKLKKNHWKATGRILGKYRREEENKIIPL